MHKQESPYEAALRQAQIRASAERQIIDTYHRLVSWRENDGSTNRWIALADIATFTDITPAEWTRALTALNTTPGMHLIPEENQKALTDTDHASAVTIGGQAKHLIAIDTPTPTEHQEAQR